MDDKWVDLTIAFAFVGIGVACFVLAISFLVAVL
jgi:hypothetical protein